MISLAKLYFAKSKPITKKITPRSFYCVSIKDININKNDVSFQAMQQECELSDTHFLDVIAIAVASSELVGFDIFGVWPFSGESQLPCQKMIVFDPRESEPSGHFIGSLSRSVPPPLPPPLIADIAK